MPSKVTLENLIQGIQFKDPRLYDVLRGFLAEIRKLGKDIDIINQPELPAVLNVFPPVVSVFTYVLRARSIHFEWVRPSEDAIQFELRAGGDWETADRILVTSSLSADIDPLLAGTHPYLLKSIDSNGTYSIDFATLDVIIHAPSGVTITAQIIDNNVLLRWNSATSDFAVDYYEVKRDSDIIGNVNGTFVATFESLAGSYTYSVTAVDIASNRGITNSVTAEVSQPPDYELSALFLSLLTGDRTDVAYFEDEGVPKLLCCANITETYEDHFINNSWDSPQEQLDAGYPYFIQPIPATGEYQEVKDFGTIFSNVIVNLDWDFINITGSTGVVAQIEVSDDNITYSAPFTGVSQFFASLRYVRVTLTFTPDADTSFMEFFNFRIILDVKREMDSGTVDALAADVGGTEVVFNKTFKDIDSITATALSTTPAITFYDFVDIPDPVHFFVFVVDETGARIDSTVSWKARGVV